jgi:Mn-dependent DtxR family transcriptional regulator
MFYQHSLEIQERLETVLVLIETGRYSTPALAKELGVSIPTVSRIVAALREKGHEIRATRKGNAWCYTLVRKATARVALGHVTGERLSNFQ